jgi:transposase
MQRLAEQFKTLPERPKSMDEAYELIKTLWQAFQWSLEMQGLHSGNASIPPSQDRLSGRAKDLRGRRKPSPRQRGAQPGHVQHARDRVPEAEVDQIERYFPDAHCACGGEIRIDEEPQHRHQVFDLPEITFTVTEHQRFGGHCQACGCSVTAKLPQEIPSGQMGPGLIAWIALMSGHFRLSTRSIQNLLSLQWGLTFSTGAISESQEPVADWLEPLYQQVGEKIRQAPAAHADETTHFRAQQRHWLWVLCTPQLAFFMIHASRGMKAAHQLLDPFAGILISDRHGAYGTHPMNQRQLCWAHVIRNLERISGRKGDPGELGLWLVRLARLVIRLEHAWRRSAYRSPHYRRRLEQARENFRIALEQGYQQHRGQRTGNACKALLDDEPMLWRFLQSPGLDLTNNTAERALRPYVIWRKTSFFSQSERGDRFRSRVMTVTESCRRLELSAYSLLRQVCEQGIRKQSITLRLPIDDLYRIPASRQLEFQRAA